MRLRKPFKILFSILTIAALAFLTIKFLNVVIEKENNKHDIKQEYINELVSKQNINNK